MEEGKTNRKGAVMKKTGILLAVLFCFYSAADGQVILGGEADFELRKGGSDSSPVVNQTPGENLTIYTPYVRLFAGAALTNKWFIEAALQADYYEGKNLSPVFFSLLNINWLPIDDSDFMISAGRFITPYGYYSDRVLSSENPFVHLPLTHAWNMGIDKRAGVFSGGVDYDVAGLQGLPMVYQRMYTQGLMVSNSVGENQALSYRLAATLASASSFFAFGEHNTMALTGRIEWNPVIWAKLGTSFSFGPYMAKDVLNDSYSKSELQKFTQLLAGADVSLSYLYYSLLLEVNYSKWNSPDYDYNGTIFTEPEVKALHLGGEVQTRLRSLAGAYVGIRGEALLPEKVRQPAPGGGYDYFRYSNEVVRAEVVFGYKINRQITSKVSYLITSTTPNKTATDVFAIQLNVVF